MTTLSVSIQHEQELKAAPQAAEAEAEEADAQADAAVAAAVAAEEDNYIQATDLFRCLLFLSPKNLIFFLLILPNRQTFFCALYFIGMLWYYTKAN